MHGGYPLPCRQEFDDSLIQELKIPQISGSSYRMCDAEGNLVSAIVAMIQPLIAIMIWMHVYCTLQRTIVSS